MPKPLPVMHEATIAAVSALKDHPRNYRDHTDAQLAHLEASIREHGLYRNVVTTSDGTILAGHGVVKACRRIGLRTIPVIVLDLDPDDPRALKLLAGDNEVGRLALTNDRDLADILRLVADSDQGLLGTGWDDTTLAGLLLVTRNDTDPPADPAEAWKNMPDFEQDDLSSAHHVTVHFATLDDAHAFFAMVGRDFGAGAGTKAFWWPDRDGDGHVGYKTSIDIVSSG